MKKITALLVVVLMNVCGVSTITAEDKFITLASTTSTQNSGLFDYLLPIFQQETGIEVRVVAVGTGQAIRLAEKGDADVLLVHDRTAEIKFVQQGYGIDRRELMYNDFVIVGPGADPARVRDGRDAVQALAAIAGAQVPFVSRADDSGTHRQELRLWDEARFDPRSWSGKWYKEVGAGMGATLNTAAGINAYTLTDRATWMNFRNRAQLEILVEGDPRLFNQYSVILVNPHVHPHVKAEMARTFSDWLVSDAGQRIIGDYRLDGMTVFFPNAREKMAAPQPET